jgi:hypothetical protein
MFKNWFLLASVSCGVGFGSTFLISRNLQQSTLAGLGTVPAVAASLTILSRQRREEIDRQVAKSRLGLDDAQRQEQLLKDRYREISLHGKTLQAELEKAINSLVLRKQTQESSLIKLDAKVLDRQNNLQTTQAELTRIQNQRQSEINSGTSRLNDSARQSNLELQRIREEIRQYSATKQQLELQITDLQNRLQNFQTILVDKEVDLRGIKYQISQMEARRTQVSISITDLDRFLDQKQSLLQNIDRQQQQSLQKEISDLLLQKQDQRVLLDNLVMNISTKRNNLLELDNEISGRQANLDRIAIDLVQIEARKQSAIDSAQTSGLALVNIQEEIRQDSAVKGELKLEITDLQNQERSLQTEVAAQSIYRTEIQQQISALTQQQEIISTSVNNLNQSRGDQQSLLDDLNLEIWNQQQCQANIYSEITELENSISLFSVHATGEVLNIGIADLYRRWQEVSQQVSQLEDKENESSIIAPDPAIEPESSIITEEWESRLTNNPYLPVFQHIDRWGSITESEVNNILGNARIGRQFNRQFREYYQYLPFSIRVETSNNSSRYVKEIITISESQNLLYIPRREIVDLHTEPEQYITEPEDDVIQYSNTNNESQSDEYLAERMIHTYPVCLFCERPPMPGQDRCNNCN